MSPQLTPVAKQDLEQLLKRRDHGLPGVCVGVVNPQGETQFLDAAGPRSAGASDSEPMNQDSVFWIASCTKLVTAIACCQLIEQGKLDLDMPAAQLLPALAEPDLIKATKSGLEIVKAKNKITLRMLLTHTAGFGYHWYSDKLRDWVAEHGIDEFNGSTLPMPLIEEPGTCWNYGINIDFVGDMVEKASGLKLGDYFQRHIFEPLGIKDATFDIQNRPDMLERLVPMQRYHPEGQSYSVNAQGTPLSNRPSIHSGGAGLFTTASEYLKILVPMINGGVGASGAQLLKAETVDMMFKDHVAELNVTKGVTDPSDVSQPEWCLDPQQLHKPGMPATWGISFLLNTAAYPTGRPQGTAEWGGLANLAWLAAPGKAGVVIFHQILPYGDPSFKSTCEEVEKIVWNGLE